MASIDASLNAPGQIAADAEVIADGDLLARQIIYPTAFAADVVGANALVQFMGDRNQDGSFSESLVLERLTTEGAIHEHGCASSKRKNEKLKEKRASKGMTPAEPVAGEDRFYYCGFTSAEAGQLTLVRPRYIIELSIEEDDGVEAHVAIYLRPTDAANKLKGADKTEAGRLLALKFGNPSPHICPEDKSDQHHPLNKYGTDVLLLKDAA
jgi:hypothetical protein